VEPRRQNLDQRHWDLLFGITFVVNYEEFVDNLSGGSACDVEIPCRFLPGGLPAV
jgi:hypothetical protein